MKKYRKKTGKKDIEETDRFLSLTERVKLYATQNTTKAYAALAVVGGVIILTVAGSMLMEQSRQKAVATVSEAMAFYDKDQPVPGGLPMGQDERIRKARELFAQVAGKQGGPQGDVASFYEANSDMALGEADKAVQGYRKLYDSSDTDPVVRTLAGLRLASALEQKGDAEGALAVYDSLAKEGCAKDTALYKAAVLYERAGKADTALAQYERLVKDFPASPWKAEAKARVSEMGGAQAANQETKADAGEKP